MQKLWVEGMTKVQIKAKYQACEIGYDYAVDLLCKLGFTEYAADQYLFAE